MVHLFVATVSEKSCVVGAKEDGSMMRKYLANNLEEIEPILYGIVTKIVHIIIRNENLIIIITTTNKKRRKL